MDSGALSLIMLVSLFFCLAVGQWTAFTLGSVGVLILLLSNHIGDLAVLREALRLARQAAEKPTTA